MSALFTMKRYTNPRLPYLNVIKHANDISLGLRLGLKIGLASILPHS